MKGTRENQAWFARELGKHLIVKIRGVLGPDPSRGDVQGIVILNRILRWLSATPTSPDCIEYEADARHAEILVRQLGLAAGGKPVATPGVKHKADDPDGDELVGERRATFRSATMRLAYLAQDRPELQFAAKEVARRMQAPTESAWQALKRAARFVAGAPRLVVRYERQPPVTYVDVSSDSDHAGCTRMRRSTSATVLMVGKHLLKTSSTTQTVISLSTGESEFYALVKAASAALGLSALGRDFGWTLFPGSGAMRLPEKALRRAEERGKCDTCTPRPFGFSAPCMRRG